MEHRKSKRKRDRRRVYPSNTTKNLGNHKPRHRKRMGRNKKQHHTDSRTGPGTNTQKENKAMVRRRMSKES